MSDEQKSNFKASDGQRLKEIEERYAPVLTGPDLYHYQERIDMKYLLDTIAELSSIVEWYADGLYPDDVSEVEPKLFKGGKRAREIMKRLQRMNPQFKVGDQFLTLSGEKIEVVGVICDVFDCPTYEIIDAFTKKELTDV